mmetsp:Transcript_38653/g.69670  ORF Transcript_38653/g.69670 Transcript_38653/m.69670 type:complete len:710 (-) Transcript_38653:248-2377(-)
MPIKIERPADMTDGGGGRLEDHRQAKRIKTEPPHHAADHAAAVPGNSHPPSPMETDRHDRRNQPPSHLCCAGCGVSDSAAFGPLLLFEDPEDDSPNDGSGGAKKAEDEKRYCAGCMTGKKVRVFWPVDSQWYIADVQQYDTNTGEHCLCYPDGDTEWVRIGEDHTTNTQYKEYFSSMKNGDTAGHANTAEGMPSLGNGVSFALSAMSQEFGLPTTAEDEKTMRLKPPQSQQQRLFQQLDLDRSASSMSSFGMYTGHNTGGIGARQLSFGQQQQHQGGRAPPFQILSPNFTHSFSSKIGTVPSLDFGPPAAHVGGKPGNNAPPPLPSYPHAAPPHQQQREEGSGSNLSATSPGTRDGAPGSHPWPPTQYSNPNFYDGAPQQMMYAYPVGQPPPSNPSYNNSKQQQQKGAQPSSSPKPSKDPQKDNAKSRKALAKAWTKAEDEHLLDLVLEMKHPLKWSIIAQSLCDFSAGRDSDTPERTGKQCRERYVNHLNPRLKHTEFTPLEDATIWRLYATVGTQWAKMSKVIPGRTDNNLKNRFHNLKRQLQREEESRLRAPMPDEYEASVHSERVREIPQFLRTKIEEMWNHKRHIGVVAANSIEESREEEAKDEEKDSGADSSTLGADLQKFRKFGPFETVTEPIQCGRCGLFIPSVQCGNEMCTKTKWCRVCTKVSMHLGGNVLRECLNLRKSQDGELVDGVDKLMNEVWNGS